MSFNYINNFKYNNYHNQSYNNSYFSNDDCNSMECEVDQIDDSKSCVHVDCEPSHNLNNNKIYPLEVYRKIYDYKRLYKDTIPLIFNEAIIEYDLKTNKKFTTAGKNNSNIYCQNSSHRNSYNEINLIKPSGSESVDEELLETTAVVALSCLMTKSLKQSLKRSPSKITSSSVKKRKKEEGKISSLTSQENSYEKNTIPDQLPAPKLKKTANNSSILMKKWKKEEDEKLTQIVLAKIAVKKTGKVDWKKIAELLGTNKNNKQCCDRWSMLKKSLFPTEQKK